MSDLSGRVSSWVLLVWDEDGDLERVQAVGSREDMEARAASFGNGASVTVELVHDTVLS